MNHLACCAATANVLENKDCYENISPENFIFLGSHFMAWACSSCDKNDAA